MSVSASATDEELMRAFQGGDARAFEELYRRYRGTLYRFLVRQAGSVPAGEELYQDVWLTLANQRERWQPTATLRTYLYRIAHSRVVDHFRRQGRERGFLRVSLDNDDAPEPACPATSADSEWTRQATADAVRRCLDALPPEQREAFLLKEESELALADIAAVAGVGAETVKSRVRYAIARLRQCLAEWL
ncbi:MAG: sigma-70 family RNA polymerase sigma factor [Pseudomonadota bacterium]